MCQYFGDVEAFLTENSDVSPATWAKLLTFFSDPSKKVCLHIQLAAIIDWGEPFVKAMYKLEDLFFSAIKLLTLSELP